MVRLGNSVPVRLHDQMGLVHIHKEGAEDQDQPGQHNSSYETVLVDNNGFQP